MAGVESHDIDLAASRSVQADRSSSWSRRVSQLGRPAPERWAWLALAAFLLAGAALLVHETRGTTFWADEWLWIEGRRGNTVATFLNPHNEHLSLVPILIYKLLFAAAGLRHYGPYRAVVIAAHLACVLLIFVYARPRVGGYFALLAALLILFFGPGWQNFLWPFQLAWLIVMGAAIGALLLLERRDRAGDLGASALLVVALASAGPGLAIALGLIVEVLQRRRWRDAWIVAVPIALYALWWLAYQQSNIATHGFLLLPRFVFGAAAGALASLAGLSGIDASSGNGVFLNWGPPLLAIAVGALVWRLLRLARIPTRVLTLLAMTLGFWIITGVGRAYVSVGPFALTSTGYESRYLYVSAVLIVLLTVELARGATMSLAPKLLVGLLVVAATVSNIGPLRDAGRVLQGAAQLTEAELGTLDLTKPFVKPNFISAGFVFGVVQAGEYFAAARELGSPAATAAQIIAMPEQVRGAADVQLMQIDQLTLEPAAAGIIGGGSGPQILDAVESGTPTVKGGCVSYLPAPFTPASATNALALTVPPAGLLLSVKGTAASIGVRRFATQFQPLGTLSAGASATLRPRPDLAKQPWHVRIAAGGPLVACRLG